jgi:hypothetical protein
MAKHLAVAVLVMALAACSPPAPQPAENVVESPAPLPSVPPPAPEPGNAAAANSPLREWLVGAWSFEASCATDFIVRYEADGALDNAGEVGRWTLDGDKVTETVTERFENGGEAPVKLDPPISRTYSVARADATHGSITIDGRTVAILRC